MKQIGILLFLCLAVSLQTASGLPQDKLALVSNANASLSKSVSQTPDHGGKIETKYDGFNYETVVTLKKMRVTCASKGTAVKNACVSLEASLHCPGVQLDYVRYATLQLIFDREDWDNRHPLDQRDLFVVVEGETIKLGRMSLINQAPYDARREILEASFPYTTFKKIALAEVVEMKVGNTIFELRDKNLSALRDLNNRVKP